MIGDFRKAFRQAFEPDLRGIALRAALLSIIALAAAAWGAWELLFRLAEGIFGFDIFRVVPGGPFAEFLLLAFGVSMLSAVAVNAAALVVGAAFPPIAPAVFLAANGYLIGREYFTLNAERHEAKESAERHEAKESAERLRKRNRGAIWLAGSAVAVLLASPVLNLVAPLIGIASFAHAYRRMRGSAPSG